MTQPTQQRTGSEGNTILQTRCRKWFITTNNYDENYLTLLTQLFSKCKKYIWQKEIGEEKQTPHLHAYIEFKNPISFKSVMKYLKPGSELKKVKFPEECIKYCSKEETRTEGPWSFGFEEKIDLKTKLLEIEYKNIIWKDWQKDIINIVENKVNKRKVFWIWESIGNIGKSFLCKYLALKYECIIASGKTNDIFNQTLEWRKINENILQLPPIIIDVPRSEYSHINYAAIEQLKNGFIYSGKYEGGKVFGLAPHCIVFANSPPELKEMSADRFEIINLNKI